MVSAEPELTGTLLESRYRVEELLAVGGMSRVYRGTDTRLDRAVALKVMDPRLARDPSFRTRFDREARAIARIDHPNVVEVYDQGEHDGGGAEPLVYLAMELVAGGNLRDVLRQRGALTVPETFAVLEAVLSGLAAAHAQGLTHRDVKPENVLISPAGVVKVADFGLVTAAAEARASTAGMIIGTMAYLSPEQVTGRDIDARSDVYACGVLLYELLTGAPPYQGDHALSVAYQHVNKDMPAPSERVPDLPPDLDALVCSATRRDPSSRPPNAETLLHALLGVRAALGIPRVAVPVPGGEANTVPVQAGPPPTEAQGQPQAPRPTRALTATELPPQAAPAGWSEPAADQSDYPRRRRRSRQLLAGWVGGIVLLGMLIASVAWDAGLGHWSAVPAVVGMDQAGATRALQGVGLIASVRQQHDNTMPAGRVVTSNPVASSQVAKGSTVVLVVSSGRPVVPTISAGTTVAQAEQILRNADLTVRQDGETPHSHPSAPPGTVIGTSPSAGTPMNVGGPVSLIISTGPAPRRHSDDEGDGQGSDSPHDLRRSIFDQLERGLRRALGG